MRDVRLCAPSVVLMVATAFTSFSASAAVDYSSTINVFKASPQVQPFFRMLTDTLSFQPSGKEG